MDKINDLIARLEKIISEKNLKDKVFRVYFDNDEDIVTIVTYHGVDKVNFYNDIEMSGMLKKDDQIAINWL